MIASPDYSMFFDLAILALLIATMVYAFVLNRKLSILRDTKHEMAEMIADFAQATGKAEQGLEAMKQMASGSNTELEARLTKAEELRKDLAFLVDKASGSCDRLEALIDRSRKQAAPAARSVEGLGRPKPVKVAGSGSRFGRDLASSSESATTRSQPQRKLSSNEANLLKALQGLR